VLDVPAGTGVLAKWLHEQGWAVQCADVDRGNFELGESFPFAELDLNRELPFEDGQFDLVVCVNGLHRLFYAKGAIREFGRVLKPGGKLLVNMNNYWTISSRIRAVLLGSVSHIFDQEYFEQELVVPESQVRIPYPLSQIAGYVNDAGLQLNAVYPVDRRPRDVVAGILGEPLRWVAMLASRKARFPNVVKWNADRAIFSGGAYFLAEISKAE